MKLLPLLISIGFCSISFSQDTCFVTIKYGENPNAGKFALVNGIRMYYETYGDPDRQPLLLIHGNGGYIYPESTIVHNTRDYTFYAERGV
jgi:hypothetical protein